MPLDWGGWRPIASGEGEMSRLPFTQAAADGHERREEPDAVRRGGTRRRSVGPGREARLPQVRRGRMTRSAGSTEFTAWPSTPTPTRAGAITGQVWSGC
jgi:hypothetical protein